MLGGGGGRAHDGWCRGTTRLLCALTAVALLLPLLGLLCPGGAATPTGVSSGGGSRSSSGVRLSDVVGAVGGGQAASGGVRLLSGLLPTVAGTTPITLVSLTATRTPTGAPLITWVLSEDSDPVGFHILRSGSVAGPWRRLTDRMLAAAARSFVDDSAGGSADGSADGATAHWYRLTAISRDGSELTWTLAVAVTPGSALPSRLALPPNVPNPFHLATTLTMEVPAAAAVRLDILDLAGRRVATLQEGELPAGRHAFLWDGEAGPGGAMTGRVASGIYWARLEAAGQVVSRKIVVRR